MVGAWEISDSSGYDVASGVDPSDPTLTMYSTYNRNVGAYAGFEQMIYKEKKDDENDMQGLTLFGKLGFHRQIETICRNISAPDCIT